MNLRRGFFRLWLVGSVMFAISIGVITAPEIIAEINHQKMPIKAQSADGMIHEFPAGTDGAVIDRVMKRRQGGGVWRQIAPQYCAGSARASRVRPALWEIYDRKSIMRPAPRPYDFPWPCYKHSCRDPSCFAYRRVGNMVGCQWV
jgi:hypothetical protein